MTRLAAAVCRSLAAAAMTTVATTASAQWSLVDAKDKDVNLKLGFLAQPQAEFVQTVDDTGWSQNLFLRRFRIIFGGNLGSRWSFFFETDSPNLGKSNILGVKDEGDVYIQDAFVTYTHADAFKVDVGMLLIPSSHNHLQSAASLLPVDYGPYTFLESPAMGGRVGRDYGVQVRGYPLGQTLEYRIGVFQGVRGTEATNDLRTVGRVAWYPFGAETGFFYTGTFQGQRRLASLGASVDIQKSYHTYTADAYYEQPLDGGQQGFSAQVNWMHFDGGTLVLALRPQYDVLVEAAFHFGKGRYSPFVQYAARDVDAASGTDQSSLQGGFAWWLKGHQRNLKVSAGRLHIDGQPGRTQVLAQLQIFFY